LNRYIYALANPVRLVDVSGLSPSEGTSSLNNGTSDVSASHRLLIGEGDANRQRRRIRALQEMAINASIQADLEASIAYYDAAINIVEASRDASLAVVSVVAGDVRGVLENTARLGAALLVGTGNEALGDRIRAGIDVVSAIGGLISLPSQIRRIDSAATASRFYGHGILDRLRSIPARSDVGRALMPLVEPVAEAPATIGNAIQGGWRLVRNLFD
jgi:hypothetical protein